MADRQMMTREQIGSWMTQELSKVEGCSGSTLHVQYLLQTADESGCNWSGDCILKTGPQTNSRHAGPIAAGIVAQAQQLFNVGE